MKLLPVEFKGKGSQNCFTFKQVKRTDDYAMYEKTDIDSGITSYEVFKIKKSKTSTQTIGGNIIEFQAKERYPSDESFGYYAWNPSSLERAEAIYESLLLTGDKPRR